MRLPFQSLIRQLQSPSDLIDAVFSAPQRKGTVKHEFKRKTHRRVYI